MKEQLHTTTSSHLCIRHPDDARDVDVVHESVVELPKNGTLVGLFGMRTLHSET